MEPENQVEDESIPDDGSKGLPAVEAGLVYLISMVVTGGIVGNILWILTGHGNATHERFAQLLREVNENWKACLLLLIPLFFRPIRHFLMNLKEGPFGMKRIEASSGRGTQESGYSK